VRRSSTLCLDRVELIVDILAKMRGYSIDAAGAGRIGSTRPPPSTEPNAAGAIVDAARLLRVAGNGAAA